MILTMIVGILWKWAGCVVKSPMIGKFCFVCLFLYVLPKMTRGKTLKSEEIDGTWRMDGWFFLLLDAVMLLHHRARQLYNMAMMLL